MYMNLMLFIHGTNSVNHMLKDIVEIRKVNPSGNIYKVYTSQKFVFKFVRFDAVFIAIQADNLLT